MRPVRNQGVSKSLTVIIIAVLLLAAVSTTYLLLRHANHQIQTTTTLVYNYTDGKLVSVANSHINFEAIDWPVILVGVGFSNSNMDAPFLNMLRQLGVQTVTIETDPTFFKTYESRFANIISEARLDGFRIHIINQLGYSSWYKLLGMSYPFGSNTSFQQFENFQYQAMQEYAKYKPNYLSVIAEPGLMQKKIATTFSTEQWSSLIQNLSTTVNSISPTTQTWVDLVPQDPFDMQLLSSLTSILDLSGIGLDVYGNASPVSTTINASNYIISHGKLGGLTETWAFSLYATPSTDVAANVPQQANWLSSSGIVQFAVQHNFTAIFDPFFSNKFTSLDPLPASSVAGLEAGASSYATSLNQRTSVFNSYQTLISEAG